MNKKKIKKYSIYYLILWIVFLIGYLLTQRSDIEYRPNTIVLCAVIFYSYPVILCGYVIYHSKLSTWIRRICLIAYFSLMSLISIAVFFFMSTMPLEHKMNCGYLELRQSGFLTATKYSYAEPKAIFFMKSFTWDAAHDIHILESTHQTKFTLAEDQGDGIPRYQPQEHPEIAVRIYSYLIDGTMDDYQYKLTSAIALDYYQKNALRWDYEWSDSREGYLTFLIHDDDDLNQYADDLSAIIATAMQDPFYQSEVGYITLKMDYGTFFSLYFGDYIPFRKKGIPKDYYADPKNILALFEEKKAGY